jgi:hypothetical protein
MSVENQFLHIFFYVGLNLAINQIQIKSPVQRKYCFLIQHSTCLNTSVQNQKISWLDYFLQEDWYKVFLSRVFSRNNPFGTLVSKWGGFRFLRIFMNIFEYLHDSTPLNQEQRIRSTSWMMVQRFFSAPWNFIKRHEIWHRDSLCTTPRHVWWRKDSFKSGYPYPVSKYDSKKWRGH